MSKISMVKIPDDVKRVLLDGRVEGNSYYLPACMNLGRHFIGIEKEERYFNIAKERISQHETT